MYLFKCERNEEVFELMKKCWTDLQMEQASMMASPLPLTTIPVRTTSKSESMSCNLNDYCINVFPYVIISCSVHDFGIFLVKKLVIVC